MRARTTALALLPIVLVITQAGCKRTVDVPVATSSQSTPAWSLDEGAILQPIRFRPADLDPDKSACNDFTGYANAKWLATNPIPGDQTSWGPWGVLQERSLGIQRQLAERAAGLPASTGIQKIVADIWFSGMDETRINAAGAAPLKERLAAIDGLTDGPAVADYLRKAAATGDNPLFSFGPYADFKNSAMNIAYAFQGGLGLPDKTYYFDADKRAIRTAYEKHVAKVLELSGVPPDQAATEAKVVLAVETRLARVSRSSEELSRDVSLYYNPIQTAAADRLTPSFPWTTFFTAQGLDPPEKFSLAIPAFHQEVSRMLEHLPVAHWKSFLRYHLVDGASPFLSDAFVAEHFEFHSRTLQGQKEMRPRWKRVLGAINDQAGEAMGQLYIEYAFPASSKVRMEALVGNLGQALKLRLEKLNWMSDETKKKALAKWATFTPKIGYPDKWRDWTGLATQRDGYVENVLAARAFNYRWKLAKIGKPVDKTEWDMTPQRVNAYYNPSQNEIVFPAGILQPPFFDAQADDPLNYGAIGAVIGHEMTHGYDDQGSRFGPTGNFEQWWTKGDAAKFKALNRKLVQQFNDYEVMPGLKVNGNLTLSENIADLGGLSVAFDAMQIAARGAPDLKIDGLSRDQRFFLGWATAWRVQLTPERMKLLAAVDSHAPVNIRAVAAPSNLPAFGAAFGCRPGDAMMRSSADLVVIW